uniref:Uncharacterized protein MANES_01G065400 n=1 Tax=Rhizophora mucronata TaxID=61149 RepID=A0A2P2M0R4_RHIMU
MASMFFSGDEVHVADDRKKEKGSKLLSGLKSKKEKMLPHHPSLGRHSALMDIVRVQMQISEAMHACIRRNLLQLVARKISQIDLPHISLELLNGIFKSDFPNEKSYMQWRSREANILEELLCIIANSMTTEVRSHVAKIRDTKQWDAAMSPSERVAVIASIRQVAMKLSSLPGKFGIEGETFYWTAGYHLNIRLYLNLLFAVFDILEEGQLIEEADDLLSIIKLTWSTLGITRKMHNALYGWVLFQQFLETDGDGLLENAVLELQKLLSAAEDDDKEEQYMNSLLCLRQWNGSELKVRLVQTILLSVTSWCDSVLQDYHLHFGQKFSNFRMVVTMVFEVGIPTDDCGEIKLTKLNASNQNSTRMLKLYVKRSTEAAYSRVASKMDLESKVERTHPLALLANELKLIAEREFKVFYPVLRECFPESMRISVFLLHQFYGEKLKPFLKGVSSLSEDVKLVLPAADMLDHYLTQLYTSVMEANNMVHSFSQDLDHYEIGEMSKPLILDWAISQHAHILEWTGRAFDIEDWEPLSFHQRQAASIVEVFRIIEEVHMPLRQLY